LNSDSNHLQKYAINGSAFSNSLDLVIKGVTDLGNEVGGDNGILELMIVNIGRRRDLIIWELIDSWCS